MDVKSTDKKTGKTTVTKITKKPKVETKTDIETVVEKVTTKPQIHEDIHIHEQETVTVEKETTGKIDEVVEAKEKEEITKVVTKDVKPPVIDIETKKTHKDIQITDTDREIIDADREIE